MQAKRASGWSFVATESPGGDVRLKHSGCSSITQGGGKWRAKGMEQSGPEMGHFTHTHRTEDKRSSKHVFRPSSRIARTDNSMRACHHTLGSRGKSSWIGVYRPTYICNLCSRLSPSVSSFAACVRLRRGLGPARLAALQR